jgi:hypothetical protein
MVLLINYRHLDRKFKEMLASLTIIMQNIKKK